MIDYINSILIVILIILIIGAILYFKKKNDGDVYNKSDHEGFKTDIIKFVSGENLAFKDYSTFKSGDKTLNLDKDSSVTSGTISSLNNAMKGMNIGVTVATIHENFANEYLDVNLKH